MDGSIDRIRDRATFRRFRSSRIRARGGPLLVVRVERSVPGPPAIAYAISRRVGNAVVRNRVRRQLREAARQLAVEGSLAPAAYLVIVQPDAAGAPMTTLREGLRTAVERLERAARGDGG